MAKARRNKENLEAQEKFWQYNVQDLANLNLVFIFSVLETMMITNLAKTLAAMLVVAIPSFGHAAVLTNGSDDGDVSVDVDAFGSSGYGFYNPVGPINGGDVIYGSSVLLTQGSGLMDLARAVDTETEVLSESESQFITRFSVNQLEFTLTQTVQDTFEGVDRTGSILTQSFAIRNLTDVPNTFSLVRYLDGDLYLNDNSLADGGGVLTQGGQLVLFETEASGAANDNDTFVGITASGGTQPVGGGFAVVTCCGVDQIPLPNTVDNDNNADGFTDTAFDVTLQLQRDFSIGVGETQVFTTTTLFGNGVPPAPGSTESLPLLPDRTEIIDGVQVFSFDIPATYTPETVIWIDPIIAVGYTYAVTGAEFFSVTAPSLAAVADGDGLYTLTVAGLGPISLASGASYSFGPGVTSFTLTGIDPTLGLDPSNPLAFVTGIALTNINGSATVTMTPITVETSPVPLPASLPLLLAGLGGIAALRRLRRTQA